MYQFETRCEDMPRISTYSTMPNYTSLKYIQDAIDVNALSIMIYTTELGHLVLTKAPAEFIATKGTVTFIIPTNSGNSPTPPPRITTRTSTAALAIYPYAVEETSDPYKAQESLRVFQDIQMEYN